MKTRKRLSVVVAVFVVFVMALSIVGCGDKNKGNGGNENNNPTCVHDWVAATCTEPEHCSKCNETRGEAAGHKFVYTTVDATCDDAGSKTGECSVCHTKTSEYLPQLSHKYVSKVEEGDCETDTVTVYTCELCKDAYSEITARHAGHDTTGVTWTVKSEEQEGYGCEYLVTETAKCNTCKEDIERTYHKHVAKWAVDYIEPATCKDEGTVYYECECGDEKYEKTETLPVNPAAHNWVESDKSGVTHECTECEKTKTEVVIEGNSATLSAEQLTGENLSIQTSDVTLQPDTTLAGKMSGGVNIAATPVNKADLPTVDEATAEKLDGAPIFNFELKNSQDQAIDFDGGKMTISVPYDLGYGEDPTTVAALYIDGEGNEQVIDAIYGNYTATFTVEHFSHYAVVRLTAAERCAKVGHDYHSVDVPATCTEDGYTVKNCRRCGDFVRLAGAGKLGHDYKPTVVAATCTDKGYTLMVCSHEGCDDNYVSKYTAMTAHVYTDTVVAPTCTVKGYTSHVCNNCGHSYRDTYVDTIAHNYVNGECTVCHKKTDAASDADFYLNLLNSLGYNDSYYVELVGAKFDANVTFMGEDGKETQTSKGEIEAYKLQVGLDDDGYLVGSGEGKMSYSVSAEGEEFGGDQKVLLAFKNKKIYMSVIQSYVDQYGKTTEEVCYVTSQDDASLGSVKDMVSSYYNDQVKAAVEKILSGNSGNNPVNAAMTKVIEALFDRTATESGYALTLNYEKLSGLIDYICEHNGADVFDAIFGEGKFASLLEFVESVPTMKFNEFVDTLVTKAQSYGLTRSDIYGVINSLVPKDSEGTVFDFAEFVKGYTTKTVPEMIELLSGGEMKAEEISETITQMAEYYGQALMSEDITLVDFVCGMFSEGEMGEMIPAIKEFVLGTLDSLIEVAEKTVSVTVYTDSTGAFTSCAVAVKDFEFETEVSAPMAPDGTAAEVSAQASLTITTESGAIGDNNNIVVAADNAYKALKDAIVKNLGNVYNSGRYDSDRTLTKIGEDYVFVPALSFNLMEMDRYGNFGEPAQGTYEGKNCTVCDYTLHTSTYVLKLDGDYSYSKDCNGWTANKVGTVYYYQTVYVLYMDLTTYTLLGYEIDFDAMEEYTYGENHSLTVYSNAVQGKISLATPHKYALIEDVKPPACEESGHRKYRCTVCGKFTTEYYAYGHDMNYTYELVDEELGCEGGAVRVGKCEKCGKEVREEMHDLVNEDGRHYMFSRNIPIEDAKCPDTYVQLYGCVCGEYIGNVYVGGTCEFDGIKWGRCWEFDETEGDEEKYDHRCKHGYYDHVIAVYQCAVTDCAYTYTYEQITTGPDANCKVTCSEVCTLQDGTVYTVSQSDTRHGNVKFDETTQGGLRVVTQYCDNCKKTVRIEKYDSYNRRIYYFDAIEKEGYEIVYEQDSCFCTEYELDEYGNRTETVRDTGLRHQITGDYPDKTSCTQAHQVIYTCEVCHNEVTNEEHYFGHDFQYDDELGMTVCADCGMTNDIYADGPVVLENLSSDGELMIGFTFYRPLDSIELYADYVGEGSGYSVDSISWQENQTGERCGILVFNTDEVREWVTANLDNGSTLSVVFVTNARGDYKDDYPDYLEISITFTAEELAEILGIELDPGSESELAA